MDVGGNHFCHQISAHEVPHGHVGVTGTGNRFIPGEFETDVIRAVKGELNTSGGSTDFTAIEREKRARRRGCHLNLTPNAARGQRQCGKRKCGASQRPARGNHPGMSCGHQAHAVSVIHFWNAAPRSPWACEELQRSTSRR